MTTTPTGDAETIEGLRKRLCRKPGCGALEIIGKPCTDWDCPQQTMTAKQHAAELASLRESLAKAEGERDEALHLVATGAYAAALKAPPSSVYHHSLALTVEFFRKAEARALLAESQVAEAKVALEDARDALEMYRGAGVDGVVTKIEAALASLETKETDADV